MAIEIISQRNSGENGSIKNIFFYVAILLLVLAVGLYFGIKYYTDTVNAKYQETQSQVAAKETPEMKEKEKQLLSYQDQIKNYSAILNAHIITSNIFSLLERLTHPKIVFSWFNINKDDAQLNLSGSADSFESLGQQILLLEGDKLVSGATLKKVSLEKDGSISFQLDVNLDPKIFTNWEKPTSLNQ